MPDYRITIDVKDVADGDIRQLAEDIANEHGENFDAGLGDFTIAASKKEGGSYFPFDLEGGD